MLAAIVRRYDRLMTARFSRQYLYPLMIPFGRSKLFQQKYFCSCKDDGKDSKIIGPSNTPHPPRDPPDDYNPNEVGTKAFVPPDAVPPKVFRPFTSPDEPLGPGAGDEACYKNSMYFSYHRFSFYELQKIQIENRNSDDKCKPEEKKNK